jgi:hypothetical protein
VTPGVPARRFTLHTPLGPQPDPSDQDVERAISAAEAIDGGFAVLERDDGAFVQFDGSVLEWNPGARLQRFDLGPRARDAFGRFARGEDVSTAFPWRDAEAELARAGARRRQARRNVFLLMLLLAGAIVLAFRLLRP